MAKSDTFKVSKRGVEPVTARIDLPESLSDPRWAELVNDVDKDVNSLAVQNLIVKIQAGARGRLEGGEAAVQEYVDSYKLGTRAAGGGSKKGVKISKDQAKKVKFSEAQLEMLRAAGVSFEDEENTEEKAAA